MNPLITCFGLVVVGALFLAQGPLLTHARNIVNPMRMSTGAEEKYAVIFDAGSTGTRIKVYKIIVRTPLRVSDVQQVPVPKPDKTKPGLSEFPGKIDEIRGYLRPLIDGALTVVPKDKQASTTIRLFATAGMRLLRDDERKRILGKVDDLLSDKGYCPFLYQRGFSKVISGQDEAVYLWVTVNFLKGLFSGGSLKSFGTLDLGGASTQNAFKFQNSTSPLPMVQLNIFGKKYPVFAHSYLSYGGREAKKLYFNELVRKTIATNQGQKVIFSPCHNHGFSTSVTVDGKNYVVNGTFQNPEFCQQRLQSLFFCPTCAFKTQPQLIGEFYSTSLFYYTFQSTGIIQQHDEIVTLDEIGKTANSFCSKSVDQLDLNKDPWALDHCFDLNYIEVMLFKGYRVNGNSFVLHNAGKLNGFDLNWTLGAALMSNQFLS